MADYGWLTPDGPIPSGVICKRVRIPDNIAFVEIFNGALLDLIYANNFEKFGTLTPDQCAELFSGMVYDLIGQTGGWCMLGSIFPYATTNPPSHCLPCDGAIYSRLDYPSLYAALDAAFIVDADTFKVPNLVNNFPFGASLNPMDPYQVGDIGGATEHTLTVAEIPAHTHTGIPHGHTTIPHSHSTLPHTHSEITALPIITTIGVEAPEPSAVPSVGLTGASGVTVFDSGVTVTDGTASVQNAGGGNAHNTMPPYIALKYCIVSE
jgi:microcystin-dependent protein